MCNGAPFTVEKISPGMGFELATARSEGQRLFHGDTEHLALIKRGRICHVTTTTKKKGIPNYRMLCSAITDPLRARVGRPQSS